MPRIESLEARIVLLEESLAEARKSNEVRELLLTEARKSNEIVKLLLVEARESNETQEGRDRRKHRRLKRIKRSRSDHARIRENQFD